MCGLWVIILLCRIAAPETFFRDFNVFQILWDQFIRIHTFTPGTQTGLWIHGQALAVALQSNQTVVDINLARNGKCGNEGAEACEPIWDELTAGGLGPAGLWLTLTVSHFLKHWVDGCCFCYFWRQWQRSSARTQRYSGWTWITVESVMLGWRPGGCFAAVGPVFAWSCRDVTPLLGNGGRLRLTMTLLGKSCMNLYD